MNQAEQSPMTMTCQEFAELLWDNMKFDTIIDEMYWSQNYRSESMYNYMLHEAREAGVLLEDAGNWDYDEYFYEMYQSMEKGLS